MGISILLAHARHAVFRELEEIAVGLRAVYIDQGKFWNKNFISKRNNAIATWDLMVGSLTMITYACGATRRKV